MKYKYEIDYKNKTSCDMNIEHILKSSNFATFQQPWISIIDNFQDPSVKYIRK